MTPPRLILTGATYLVTQRTLRRLFKLRPDADVKNLILYLLGHAERRFGIVLHAFQFTSNHFHLVVTDVRRRLPRFMQWFNSLLARAINCYYRESGEFWRRRSYSAVRLPKSGGAVSEKIVYTLANVTTAGLVESHQDWPGVTSFVGDGAPVTYRAYKPDFFFSKTNKRWPEFVEFTTRVPEVEGSSPAVVAARIREQVEAVEAEAREERARRGLKILGADGVLKQDRDASPRNREPWGRINPRFAGRGATYYAMRKAELAFRHSYREAFQAYCAGRRNTRFPHGTWQMVVLHRAQMLPATPGISA
ncbi:MAG: transposase [Planctomycetota bacterium]